MELGNVCLAALHVEFDALQHHRTEVAGSLDVHAEEFLVDSALVDDVGACLRSLDGAYLHRALAVFAHLGVPALGCVARCFGLGVEHHCECAVDTL